MLRTTSTTDILTQRRIQSRLNKAAAGQVPTTTTSPSPFLAYAQKAFNNTWANTTSVPDVPPQPSTTAPQPMLQTQGATKQGKLLGRTGQLGQTGKSTSSKIPTMISGPRSGATTSASIIPRSTTAMRSMGATSVATKVSLTSSKSTLTGKSRSVDSLPRTLVVLQDNAQNIARYLQQHPSEQHESNRDFRAFKFSSRYIQDRLVRKKNDPVRIIPHNINALKLIQELKRASLAQVKEFFIVKSEETKTSQPASNDSSENRQDTNAENSPNNEMNNGGQSSKIESEAIVEAEPSTKPSIPSKRLAKEMKELPSFGNLKRLCVEHALDDPIATDILVEVIKSSTIKDLQISEDFVFEGLGNIIALKRDIRHFSLLPSISSKPSISPKLLDSELGTLLSSTTPDATPSSLQSLRLRNVMPQLFQPLSNLGIRSLEVHWSDDLHSQSIINEENVPRITGLENITIAATTSSTGWQQIIHSLCPATLSTLQIHGPTDQLLSVSEDSISHLSNLKHIRVTNVDAESLNHLVRVSNSSIETLTISYSTGLGATLSNSILASLASCSRLRSVRISNCSLSNQLFNILNTTKSKLQHLSLENTEWKDDSSSWEKLASPESESGSEQEVDSNPLPAYCSLESIWLKGVTFKVSIPEEVPAKGKAPAKKPVGKGVVVESEYNESDVSFSELCEAVPALETLILKESNFGDAHLQVLNATKSIRSSLKFLEISDSTKPITQPILKNSFPSLTTLLIHSSSQPNFLSTNALLTLGLLCPSICILKITTLLPHSSQRDCAIFQEITTLAKSSEGSMWGTYLKNYIFATKIVPRLLEIIPSIYSLERDCVRVRNGLQKASQKFDVNSVSTQSGNNQPNEFDNILTGLYKALFEIVGPDFD